MKAKNELRSVVKNNLWMLRKVWKHTPMYIICMIAEGVLWGINNSIDIIYMKVLLDSLGNGNSLRNVLSIVILYIAYRVVFYIFHHWYWDIFNPRAIERLYIALNEELFAHALSLDLAKYDDPEFYNEFVWSMKQTVDHAIGLVEDTGKLINRIVASVTLTGVLFSVDVGIATVIFVIAILQIIIRRLFNKIHLKFSEELNPPDRKLSYINRVYQLGDYAKEVRTTHVSDILLREFDNSINEKKAIYKKYAAKQLSLGTVSNLITAAAQGIPLIMVLYKVMVSKTLGIGGFAVAIDALWTMSWLLGDMVSRIMGYHEHGIFIEKIHRFLDTKSDLSSGTEPAPEFKSLSIKGLSFRYSDNANDVLSDVNMEINRGEKIAIVGYNGAGKTTLTKLIMHLYEPSSGEILYNGKSINEYDIQTFRDRVAAVFQDHRLFGATIAENVSGGFYTEDMEASVREALNKSTFDNKLESLPKGLDTILTREFDEDGTQLSGGETQKIAISRAFFKNADVIILDEPSSALDPEAEYALNKSISEYAKNKAVIFISHRLSTTRHADRIYMFDNGRIIESGSHDELMRLNGKYAYMFELQAKEYKKL